MMLFILRKLVLDCILAYLKNPLGQHFITGATREGVITISRWHLMSLQDGTLGDYTTVM